MQQQPRFHSQPLALFRPHALEETPQTYAWFEEMRSSDPVFYDGRSWHAFRYEEVSQVLTDYTHFSSQVFGLTGSFLQNTLVAKDPPDHRKLRNLVNQAFTPRTVARLSDRNAQIAQALLDEVKSRGKMDVVSDIPFPLPAKVIAEMLSVPPEHWDIFQRWARVDSSDAAASRRGAGRSQRDEMSDYVSQLLDKRARPAPA